jgi:hypothetical protein
MGRPAFLLKTMLALLGMGIGLAGMVLALRQLHAEVLWSTSERALQRAHGVVARDAAQKALARFPREYRYLEQAARVDAALARPSHAFVLWQEALRLRPSWPYAWARLTTAELKRPDRDAPLLEHSFERLWKLGGSERGLWKLLAIQYLDHVDDRRLPARVRDVLQQALRHELKMRRNYIANYALSHHQEVTICEIVEKEEGPQKWCEGARAMRAVCDRETLPAQQRAGCQTLEALWRHLSYPGE